MRLINISGPALLLLGSTLAAQPVPAQATPAQPSGVKAVAMQEDVSCSTKGCPKMDQNGQGPLSCAYTSNMSTGWQCILICTYRNSNWGTTSASANCN